MERYGIPASITMAQGILESDCGNSWLSQASNNHFGIKCKRNWTGDVVYYDDDEKGECFRSYPSVEASYQDHAEFLDSQPRYDSLFSYAPNDYKSWARGLKPPVTLRLRTMRSDSSASSKRVNSTCSTARTDLPFTERKPDTSPTTGSRAKATSIKPQRSLGAVDPDDYRVTVNAHKGYNVYRTNGVNYILAHDGDTFEKISRDFRISARNLRKFNDVSKNAQPVANEVIYIGRKKKRWDGNVLLHTVREGETLWSLGQSYGIRTKSLARLNKLKEGDALTPGTTIKIR